MPLTIKEYLETFVIPELLLFKQKSSSRTTLAAHARFENHGVRLWKTFEEDLNQSSQKYDINLPIASPLSQNEPFLVNCEASVVTEFNRHVQGPFLAILKSLGYSYSILAHFGLKCIRFDPDAVLIDNNATTPLCLIEWKSPWAFPIDKDLDISVALLNEKEKKTHSQKVTNALAQLYGYLSFNHMKYGILTNYDYFIFFRRSSDTESVLSYSRPIPKERILKVLLDFFFLIKDDSFYASPAASPIEHLKDFNIRQSGRNKLVEIGPQCCRFSQVLGDTRNGGVVKGNLGGLTSPVVFKLKNICRANGIAASLQNEADTFEALAELQGIAIPILYGHVDFNGVFFALVQEDCGESLPDQCDEEDIPQIFFDSEIRDNAMMALRALHSKGYLHGDIAERNICFRMDSKEVRLVDLGKTLKCSEPASFISEMEELASLFPSPPKKKLKI